MFYRWMLAVLMGIGLAFPQEVMLNTQTWQVGASSDDAWKTWVDGYGWSFSTTTNINAVGVYNVGTNYKRGCGMRWTNITIPQGATISSAYLKLCCLGTYTVNTVRSKIRGDDEDNASTFSDLADFDGRPRTTAIVYWDNIPPWDDGVWYTSPDIKTVIQEIIDRPGWSSGNSLAIFWDDFDNRSDQTMYCTRAGYSYNSSPANAPELEVFVVGIEEISTTKPKTKILKLDVSPNPFKKTLCIRVQTLTNEKVSLRIYDISGRCVKTFFNNQTSVSESQNLFWCGKDDQGRELSAGIYFVRLKSEDYKEIEKVILLR
jgi:hypothetical protein